MTTPSKELSPDSCAALDLCHSFWACCVWCAAGALFVAGWFDSSWRPAAWLVALVPAGLLCLVNASRCRRIHCYITGPLYLLGALLTVLLWAGVLGFPWKWLGSAMLIGFGLSLLLESFQGRYAP